MKMGIYLITILTGILIINFGLIHDNILEPIIGWMMITFGCLNISYMIFLNVIGTKTYLKDFYVKKIYYHWYILPTIIFYYNKNEFLETGVYTPAWSLVFKWLKFQIGFQIQTAYEKNK